MDSKMMRDNNNLFNCIYCNKNYVRKSAYNNHLIKCRLCRFSSISANSTDNDLNFDALKKDVNINNLFSMVIMLHNKYERLESEYNELKKYVNITKNKINIVDYLNEHYKNDYLHNGINVKKFLDDLVVDEIILDKIFKYDYVEGILNILIEYIQKLQKNKVLIPIKCFNNKENVLYIFDNEEWIVMDELLIISFIKSIDKKLLTQFLIWKIDAEKKVESEIFGEIYIKNMKKVIGGNFEKKNKAVMIKNKLYKYLKIDLKSIVHYEFV